MPELLALCLRQCQTQINQALATSLPTTTAAVPLMDAAHYCLNAGGKRLRPFMCFAASELFAAPKDHWLTPALAIEMIHSYSLVHDDLPAMDDDHLRRGQPTCHIRYDEATAILVGDALQSQAFLLLAQAHGIDVSKRLLMVTTLAKASGFEGMVLGQALDMAAENRQLTQAELAALHGAKTGALIQAALRLGALCGQASEKQLCHLDAFGQHLGLLYQVTDDILDLTADSAVLGKPQGSDQDNNKCTYVSLLGLAGAQAEARRLQALAHQSLDNLGQNSPLLRQLTDYIVERPA